MDLSKGYYGFIRCDHCLADDQETLLGCVIIV